MADAVVLDKMSVRIVDGGLRLSLEGFVPRSLWPSLAEAEQPGFHHPSLKQIAEALPKLIPPLHLRNIEP